MRSSVRRMAMVALVALLALPVLAGFEEQRSFSGDRLTVRNLIGEIRVEGHGGSNFEALISVQGKDATREAITIESSDGGAAELTLVFPAESSFVYPKLGAGSSTNFRFDNDSSSWLSRVFGVGNGRSIRVRGSGSGTEIWADVTIKVPSGGSIVVQLGVGEVEARNVDGNVELWTRAGHAGAADINGDLVIDTGSGHATVARITGEVSVDTGSGHVEGEELDGSRVLIDTGSGHVTLELVRADSLEVDTGSGNVRATRISVDSVNIDTGSGGVTLQLDEAGDGPFRIDTGSGGVKLTVPFGFSADVEASTGSGGVNLRLDEPVTILHKERNEIEFRMGAGDASVSIDTGSGKITIGN